MPLSFTPLLRLKRCHACAQWYSSRVHIFLPVHTINCVQTLKASVDQDDDGKVGGPSQQLKKVEIAHPDMTDDMIKNIKNAWTESRLVAD
jgi:hypothetical protein